LNYKKPGCGTDVNNYTFDELQLFVNEFIDQQANANPVPPIDTYPEAENTEPTYVIDEDNIQ
jgi:hypothetical protein